MGPNTEQPRNEGLRGRNETTAPSQPRRGPRGLLRKDPPPRKSDQGRGERDNNETAAAPEGGVTYGIGGAIRCGASAAHPGFLVRGGFVSASGCYVAFGGWRCP